MNHLFILALSKSSAYCLAVYIRSDFYNSFKIPQITVVRYKRVFPNRGQHEQIFQYHIGLVEIVLLWFLFYSLDLSLNATNFFIDVRICIYCHTKLHTSLGDTFVYSSWCSNLVLIVFRLWKDVMLIHNWCK